MHGPDTETRIAVWGQTIAMRVSSWTIGAALIGVSIGLEFLSPWTITNLFYSLLGLVGAFFFVHQLGTGRIELYEDVVVFDGWLRPRRKIPLATIQAVEPDRYGLFFRTGLHDGVNGPNQIGAKGLGLTWLKYRARGDRIADAIMAAARDSGTEPSR